MCQQFWYWIWYCWTNVLFAQREIMDSRHHKLKLMRVAIISQKASCVSFNPFPSLKNIFQVIGGSNDVMTDWNFVLFTIWVSFWLIYSVRNDHFKFQTWISPWLNFKPILIISNEFRVFSGYFGITKTVRGLIFLHAQIFNHFLFLSNFRQRA